MTTRTQVAVVIRYVRDGAIDRRTTYYGPFLPHCGSAVTSLIAELDEETSTSGRWTYWEAFIEPVFIGTDESDAAVRATR